MTERHRALVTAPFRGEGWDTLNALIDVVYDPWIEQVPLRLLNGEQLAARLTAEGADILIVESDSVKGPVFEVPLLAIGSCRGDPNNVDVEAATKAGIPVLPAPGRNADGVAELTIALLFAANRFVVPADHDVRAGEVYAGGKIPYQRYRAWQLAGRTAGIIGLGAVGRAAKWRFEGLGMRALSFDPYNPDATHHSAAELQAMLAECDVVSMHAMVTPETERLMGAAQFAAMKPTAYVVNTSRGGTIDEIAMTHALREGRIAGAALDVLEQEPPHPDNPLLTLPNVLLTAHTAGHGVSSMLDNRQQSVDQVLRFLGGLWPTALVNPEVKTHARVGHLRES